MIYGALWYLHTKNWLQRFDIKANLTCRRVFKVSNDTHCFSYTFQNCCTMRFVSFAFAVFGIYCFEDLNDVFMGGESKFVYCIPSYILFHKSKQEISSIICNLYFLSSAFFLHVTEFCDFLDVDCQNSHRSLDVFLPEECEEYEQYSECFGNLSCQKTCENIDHWSDGCARMKICIRGAVCEGGTMSEKSIVFEYKQ